MSEMIPLSEAFMNRPGRFRLLEKGFNRTGWTGSGLDLMEPGCSVGDASAFVARQGHRVTAFDLSEELIGAALLRHDGIAGLRFFCADASSIPVEDNSFDGIYCEAAFSPMTGKDRILKEYERVLRNDGKLLVNDFFMRQEAENTLREEVVHIPCFAGVQTRECYERLFSDAGFKLVEFHEEYGELIGITAWLCRVYKVSPNEIGSYLSMYFHDGASDGAACGAASGRDGGSNEGDTFFKRSELSYCQMIFQKKG